MLNLETLKRLAEHKEKFPGVENVTLPLALVDEMAQKLIGLECVRRLNVVIKKRQADRIAELEAQVKELYQVAHKCAVKGLQDAAELARRVAVSKEGGQIVSDLNKLKEIDYSDIPIGYKSIIMSLIDRAEAAEIELVRLKAQEPVAYTDAEELETLNKGTFADMFTPCDQYKNDPQWIPLYAETRPAAAVPEGWEACSPEWIERNGSRSCAEAPRIAFGNTGPHYHPAGKRTVNLPQRWNVYAAVPFNETEARGVMVPAEEGRWVSVLDVEHLLRGLGVKVTP